MFYREIAPAPDISHLVLSFWEFSVNGESSEPIIHEVFPDGCISLFYKRKGNFGANTFFIHGLTLEIYKTQVFTGDLFWGMRFMPSACEKVLRNSPAEIKPHLLSNSNEFTHLTKGLSEKLAVCKSFEQAIEIYENQLRSLNLKSADTDEKIAETVRMIEENRGEIKISEVAEMVHLSERQLERRFRKSAGLLPKQFARVRRMRAAAISVVEETNLNWANRAAEIGFTDQAHLAHEFSSLTGRSPNSFAEKVKRIEHGNIIK